MGFCERLKDFGVETSVGTTGKWELGYSVPNAYQLIALCLALDIEDQIPFFMKNYTPALNSEGERKVQEYRDALTAAGLVISGLSPDGRLVETVELRDHPFFVGVQFHPEFKSRPNRPHPLFLGFLEAALAGRKD